MTLHSNVANVYSDEHQVQKDLAQLLAHYEYEMHSYTIKDKGPERTLILRARRNREVAESELDFEEADDDV